MDHPLPQRARRPGAPPLARLAGLPEVAPPTLDRASPPPAAWLGALEPAPDSGSAPGPEAGPEATGSAGSSAAGAAGIAELPS
ncbi:MAG: hypothetical protein AB7O37_23255 [Vicinamibacteria bacterium]